MHSLEVVSELVVNGEFCNDSGEVPQRSAARGDWDQSRHRFTVPLYYEPFALVADPVQHIGQVSG